MRERGVTRAQKVIPLTISNEDVNNIIRIIKPLKNLGVLIDGVSETVKREIKRQEGGHTKNFRYFNVWKYVNWKRKNES